MKCCNWGRDGGYLCFAFALTGPPGFLVWCPFCRLGNKNEKSPEDDKEADNRSAESDRRYKTVMRPLTAANTEGTHRTTHEKTLTSFLFVYCVNMVTAVPAKRFVEGSRQGTQGGSRRAEDDISM